jgi:hypothetical protein
LIDHTQRHKRPRVSFTATEGKEAEAEDVGPNKRPSRETDADGV